MPAVLSARTAFAQCAANDNVPVRRRRLARLATMLAIAGTSVALVLVHSVVAWFPAPSRPFAAARVSDLRAPAPVVLALATGLAPAR